MNKIFDTNSSASIEKKVALVLKKIQQLYTIAQDNFVVDGQVVTTS